MATKIYDTGLVEFFDGTVLELKPIKIKYLREFMDEFQKLKMATSDDEAFVVLTKCASISMKEFKKEFSDPSVLEDNMDVSTLYEILDLTAGIKIDKEKNEEGEVKKQAEESGSSWDNLDLAELEAETFLIGIWKDYEELELSLSMPELLATLNSKRDLEYNEKKFLAAMQGVDLDKQSGKQNEWEKMKAKVFSKGITDNPNDIVALQGVNAQQAGFGIGLGLGYEDMRKK
jgi:hypothetical protein